MDADGSHPRNLTQNPANDEMPSWSPDGKRIVFTRALGMSGKWPNRKLFVMGADGSNVRQLTFGGDPDWAPAWSPDGAQIAFSSTRETRWNRIWIVNAGGGDPYPVTRDGWNDMTPSWSPDGRRLLFDRRKRYTERDTLISVNRDGTDEKVVNPDLSGDLRADYYADYSPDGRKVVFGREGEIVSVDLATGASTRLAGRRSDQTAPLEDMLDPVTGEAWPWARAMLGETHYPRWRR
jgi:Tol biopolymer transport system component